MYSWLSGTYILTWQHQLGWALALTDSIQYSCCDTWPRGDCAIVLSGKPVESSQRTRSIIVRCRIMFSLETLRFSVVPTDYLLALSLSWGTHTTSPVWVCLSDIYCVVDIYYGLDTRQIQIMYGIRTVSKVQSFRAYISPFLLIIPHGANVIIVKNRFMVLFEVGP